MDSRSIKLGNDETPKANRELDDDEEDWGERSMVSDGLFARGEGDEDGWDGPAPGDESGIERLGRCGVVGEDEDEAGDEGDDDRSIDDDSEGTKRAGGGDGG